MHTKDKGDIAELAVAIRLLQDGWQVLFPFGENGRYDIVAEREGRFIRVQVKYVTPKNGVLTVNCRSSNNWNVIHYSPEDIDAIAAYDSVSKEVYFISSDRLNRSMIKIRLIDSKNHQMSKINFAKDFVTL